MDKQLLFSEHACTRITQRLKLGVGDLSNLIRNDAFVVVESFKESDGSRHKSILVWDCCASKPVLMVINERQQVWHAVTVYIPDLFTQNEHPRMVLKQHIRQAYRLASQLAVRRKKYWPPDMQVWIVVTPLTSKEYQVRRFFVNRVCSDDFHADFGSLRSCLNSMLTAAVMAKLNRISVPQESSIRAVLYHYPKPLVPSVYEELALGKETVSCVEAL